MARARELLGVGGVVALAWLAFTCGKAEPEPPAAPVEPSVPARDPAHPDDPPTALRATLEDMRAAQHTPRHPSDAGGRAWVEPESSAAERGRSGRWVLGYEAGPLGIVVGGFVRLTIPAWWGWSRAQSSEPEAPGYTTAECSAAGVSLESHEAPWDDEGPHWLDFIVRGRALAAGERIRIVYGAGVAGARADKYPERESRFWISVDGDGDGYARILPDSPSVDVAPGPAAGLSAVLPSTAQPGETVLLRLAFLDPTGGRGAAFTGDVTLIAQPKGLELPETVHFAPEDKGVKAVELRASAKGVYRLAAHAADEGGDFVGSANPLLVDDNIAPIRWGDFHGHSNLSDGTGTPEDYLAYARDVAGLDAIALTDHDHWGMLALDEYPELWARIQAASERANEPGKFVTVLGYEWTNWIHGHRHVLYFGTSGDGKGGGEVLSSIDERYETPKQLWDALRGQDVLTFAHHSAGGTIATDWSFAPDPELEPVTEVASVQGASEAADAPQRISPFVPGNTVRDALARGYVLGFIGSGDSHDGHPGLAHLVNPRMGGLAAVLTDELTRAGIKRAFEERRCYATNGPRVILRAALDGQRMGSTVAPRTGASMLYVRAIGCAAIASLELVRSGSVVETQPGEGHWDIETAFRPADLVAGEYLYVRVVQTDGGAAWSSPFYVR